MSCKAIIQIPGDYMKNKIITTLVIVVIIVSGLSLVIDNSLADVVLPNDSIDNIQYINGDWVVNGYENYSNEIIVLTGNLTITGTGMLELVNVTLQMNSTHYQGEYRIGVWDGATFYVNDTDDDMSTKWDASHITNGMTPGLGFDFHVNDTASFHMRNSFLNHCGRLGGLASDELTGALMLSDNVTIAGSEIYECANGIVVDSSNFTMSNTTIHDCQYNGILVRNDTHTLVSMDKLTVVDSMIHDNDGPGISVIGDVSNLFISGSQLLSNGGPGLQAVGGNRLNITLLNTTIQYNVGGGLRIGGVPGLTTLSIDISECNVSENLGGPQIRLGFMGSSIIEEPVGVIYTNITGNSICCEGSNKKGTMMVFAREYIRFNMSNNDILGHKTTNGVHVGKLAKEINTQPACNYVNITILNNNITNQVAGALRVCALIYLDANVTGNHIYHPDGLMSCGGISFGWFKAGTPDTTPESATVIVRDNIFEGIMDSGGLGIKAINDLDVVIENNIFQDVSGAALRIGWLDDSDARSAPAPWAYPTRRVNGYIVNNTMQTGSGPGIWVYSSNSTQISGNHIMHRTGSFSSPQISGDGIRIESNLWGARIYDNVIENCTATGIRLHDSSGTSVHDNELRYNGNGLAVEAGASGNIMFNNTITKHDAQYGFHIGLDALNNKFPANNTVNNEWLRYFHNINGLPSSPIQVNGHTVLEPNMANLGQIIIAESDYMDVHDNIASNGASGISLVGASHSNVHDNIVENNGYGIWLQESASDNCVYDNNLWSNTNGIGLLTSSVDNSFWRNDMVKNDAQTGLYLQTDGSTWDNSIPTNNTVNGQAIMYYYQISGLNLEGMNISEPLLTNVGQLALISCSDIMITNSSLSDGRFGIYSNSAHNLTISETVLSGSVTNMYSIHSSNVSLNGVTANLGTTNIYLHSVDNASLKSCTLKNGTNSVRLISSSPTINHSTIGQASANVLYISSDSHPVFLNTTFDKTAVTIESGSNLTVMWNLDLHVSCNNVPIYDANVSIWDIHNNSVFEGSTDIDGRIETLQLKEYVENDSGNITAFDPYAIVLKAFGFDECNSTLTLDATKHVTIEMLDIASPTVSIGPTFSPGFLGISHEFLWLNATFDDSSTGNSSISVAEWCVSSTYPSQGHPTGSMDFLNIGGRTSIESVTAMVNISSWDKGSYTLWVRCQDGAGNWCDWESISMTVYDDMGPDVVNGIVISPENPRTSVGKIFIDTVIDDTETGASPITGAEWLILPTIPASDASGCSLEPTDGTFDSSIEPVSGYVNISSLSKEAYIIWIRGTDNRGNSGSWVNATFEVMDDEAPLPPSGLSVTVNEEGNVKLEWSAGTDPDLGGYKIYRSEESGRRYEIVAILGPNETSWQDTNVEEGVTYYYVITSFDTNPIPNESPYSEEIEVTSSVVPGGSVFLFLASYWWVLFIAILAVVFALLMRRKPPGVSDFLSEREPAEEMEPEGEADKDYVEEDDTAESSETVKPTFIQ